MRRIGVMLLRRGWLLAVVVLGSLAFAGVASAATYTVNDTRDLPQSTTASSGACTSTGGTCTLRTAFQAANENGGSNTINLPAGTFNLTDNTSNGTGQCPGTVDDSIQSLKVNQCDNSTSVTVIGTGSGSTVIDGQGNWRILDLFENGSLDVQKMTLENGDGTSNGDGTEGIVTDDGGAIDSAGHLSAESVTFTGNSTGSTGSGGGAISAEHRSGSTLSATGDVFQNNTARFGGAVYTDAPNDLTVGFSLFQANNSSHDGGAFYGASQAAGLTMSFDDLVQNVAAGSGPQDGGGGIYWDGSGALNISNSLFNQNQSTGTSADDGGGGLYNNADNNLNITSTSFDGNTAANNGGGLEDFRSNQFNVTLSKFSGNSATSNGGGAEVDNSSTTLSTFLNDELDGNSAFDGGGMSWDDGALALLGSSFVLNNASDAGGALYAGTSKVDGGLLTMEDSTMSRNTAHFGGGIYASTGTDNTLLTMLNDTIAFNNAGSGDGGGISHPGDFESNGGAAPLPAFGVENTTIAENTGQDCTATFDNTDEHDDAGNNNDSDQTCFGGLGGPNDKPGVNPLLANPANNGGPSAGGPGDTETIQTDAEQASSPTVDAGNNNGCPSVDERGVTRPQGKACDIGAYEFGASPGTTSTTTATTSIGVTTTTSKTTTTTKTTTKPGKKRKRCPKGKHRSRGKCVKNKKHKKHHKKHKK